MASKVLLVGACVLSCYAFLAHSKATHHQVKRDSESLYDNIYSAIAEFSSNPEEEDLPPQKRSSNFGQGSNQLPRGGRQATRQVVVDGFPNGLPQGTPKGVAIALASAQNLAPGEMPPIPGEAGVDYPVLTEVPETGFDCNAQTFPGIYADTGADCQVFYMCQPNGNFNAFLCPNGTVFNQQYFICDWWYNFDCGDAESFYGLNEFIYQDQPAGNNAQGSGGNNGFSGGSLSGNVNNNGGGGGGFGGGSINGNNNNNGGGFGNNGGGNFGNNGGGAISTYGSATI
ncbi:ubiquitin-binding protein Rv1468c-like isoform X4 [Tigriopus californicus]|uniref:ubiquitin-binding protein Rv1468c-like isoform X4 n=1 Tax=Tigriopus californicus TaxID=6832 RepID=UPI0027D9D0F6|nr:ubiquitin-binding protein Rv1468c-like isoform X4 [Tigriopus californicus]